VALNRLRSNVPRNPLLIARAITNAITPAATPITEITVMTEIIACLRLAFR
jgi:hypothetical protein